MYAEVNEGRTADNEKHTESTGDSQVLLKSHQARMHSEFLRVTSQAYRNMVARVAEKKDKNGRLIRRGRDVPFTLEELREFTMAHFRRNGEMHWTIPCAYGCGRQLSLRQIRFEHEIPLSRGGSLALSNIVFSDSDCNTLKGQLNPAEFRALMDGLKTFPEAARRDILGRLRGRMKFLRPKAKTEVESVGIH